MGFEVQWNFGKTSDSYTLNRAENNITQYDEATFKSGATGKINATVEEELQTIELSEDEQTAVEDTTVEVKDKGPMNMEALDAELDAASQDYETKESALMDLENERDTQQGLLDASIEAIEGINASISALGSAPEQTIEKEGENGEKTIEVNPEYEAWKKQHDALEEQLKAEEAVRDELQEKISAMEKDIETAIEDKNTAQTRVDNANAAMAELMTKLQEDDKLGKNEEFKQKIVEGRNTALGEVATVAGEINKAWEENKDAEEGVKLNRDDKQDDNIFTSEQLERLGIDADATNEQLNQQIKDKLKGVLSEEALEKMPGVDLSDGLSESEARKILSATGQNFKLGEKMSSAELENLLNTIGVETEKGSVYADSKGFTVHGSQGSVGLALNNDDHAEDENKYWETKKDENGNVVSSGAIYTKDGKTKARVENIFDNENKTATSKMFEYNDKGEEIEVLSIEVNDVKTEDKSSYTKLQERKAEEYEEDLGKITSSMTEAEKENFEDASDDSSTMTSTEKLKIYQDIDERINGKSEPKTEDVAETTETSETTEPTETSETTETTETTETSETSEKKEVSSETIAGGAVKVVEYDDGSYAFFEKDENGEWSEDPYKEI